MTGKNPLNKQVIGAMISSLAASPLARSVWEQAKSAALEQATRTALEQVVRLPTAMADRRRKSRLLHEAIYRHLDKVRVIGEAALALGDEGLNEERQRTAGESTALRDALHEQLADWRLSFPAQNSEVLDAAQTAIKDADCLVSALNKWSLNSSDGSLWGARSLPGL
jgi:hypothetical protein